MAHGSGFDGADFSEFFNGVDVEVLFKIMQAKEALREILLKIDQALVQCSKRDVIHNVSLLQITFKTYVGYMRAEVREEVSDLITGLRAALMAKDVNLKSGYMAKIEAWHASKPAFILHLPELRQIVFS